VNAPAGDCRCGDVLPSGRRVSVGSAAVHGGKASQGRNAPRESAGHGRVARKGGRIRLTGGNVVNPRVGSALQDTRVAREEEPDEVVETTRSEHGRSWLLLSEGGS
jgi:hypothetical protein